MTNREWLLNKMQNMSDEEFNETVCLDCAEWGPLYKKCATLKCEKCCLNWLKSEHKEKITLSEAERVILENIDKDYKWIARDDWQNQLFIYTTKPIKNEIKCTWGAEGDNAD